MLAVTLTRADGELALVWRSAAHLGHRPDWGGRVGRAWGLVGCGRRERGMAGLSPGRTDTSHGCPVWDRPSWDWHPSLEKLSPVLWPCPAQGGRRFVCACAGGPGDPCTHVPGRPGGRLLVGGLAPCISSLPHTSYQHFMFCRFLTFFSLNIFLEKLYFHSCPARFVCTPSGSKISHEVILSSS